MMGVVIAILLSGCLYRVPRGGPSGLLPSSVLCSLIWAVLSACMIVPAVGGPLWFIPVMAVMMFAGEAPGYMDAVSDDGIKVKRLTLRGLLLLNPLMGVIYHVAWLNRDRLPKFGRWMDGFTAWAELFCGFVVACSYALLVHIAGMYV